MAVMVNEAKGDEMNQGSEDLKERMDERFDRVNRDIKELRGGIKELRIEVKGEISELRGDINEMRQTMTQSIIAICVVSIGGLATILAALIGMLA